MAQTVSVIIGSEDRARLAAILGDRNRPLKHTQRANIILLSAERLPVLEVAHCAGVSRSETDRICCFAPDEVHWPLDEHDYHEAAPAPHYPTDWGRVGETTSLSQAFAYSQRSLRLTAVRAPWCF